MGDANLVSRLGCGGASDGGGWNVIVVPAKAGTQWNTRKR